MRKIILLLLAAFMAATLFGCGQTKTEAVSTIVPMRATVEIADPQNAAQSIYAQLENRKITKLSDEQLEEQLRISPDDVEEYLAYLSDPNSGLANLVILLPKADKRDALRTALQLYQSRCMEEYRSYDILSSYSIAQGAQVFDQGDYLILLMMPNNDDAREIIDQYMPL